MEESELRAALEDHEWAKSQSVAYSTPTPSEVCEYCGRLRTYPRKRRSRRRSGEWRPAYIVLVCGFCVSLSSRAGQAVGRDAGSTLGRSEELQKEQKIRRGSSKKWSLVEERQ
jgi:hypothetical protein